MPQKNRKPEAVARRPLRVGLLSLGCPKNLVDSEVMLGLLRKDGCEVVADPGRADVVVVNTCSFIESARRESVDAILEMARVKGSGPGRRLVVTGCMVQRYESELQREIPEIDATLGTGEVGSVVAAVRGRAGRKGAPTPPTWVYDHTTPRVLSTPSYLAYLKISEGCGYTCSFCIIPRLRGAYRSRPMADILAEARGLADGGVRELVLVAQDTSRYGWDLGRRDGLAVLLRRLARIDGLRWIRVMYAYPTTLSDGILEVIAEEEKIVKYLDLPLQHASERILKMMRRPVGRSGPLALVERIRARIPDVALRSSFIVGFPGETEAEFAELLSFLRQARFEHVGAFTYSDEEGTRAFELPGRIEEATKQSRRSRLMRVQQGISLGRNRRLLGAEIEVLVEGPRTDVPGRLTGRTAKQAPEIDGCVVIREGRARPGSFVHCEVVGVHPYDLVARVLEGGSERASRPRAARRPGGERARRSEPPTSEAGRATRPRRAVGQPRR
jgi:ribosomal protein S12 methylthiotransferase